MKRGDLIWAATVAAVLCALAMPATRNLIVGATLVHPYAMGFCKFFLLATLGELLGIRLRVGQWKRPVGLFWRAIVWGVLGGSLALIFQVFNMGVRSALAAGLLPTWSGIPQTLWVAFWISTVMNTTFAPTMMVGHRMTDTYIEMTGGKIFTRRVRFSDVIAHIDWQTVFGFLVVKTIPFFWIPAHTITFLMPPEFRVLTAAFLSIALGGILAFAHPSKKLPDAPAVLAEPCEQVAVR